MPYLGDYAEDYATLNYKFNTAQADGTPILLDGSPVVSIYEGSATGTEVTTGVTLAVDFDGITGLNNVLVDLSAAAFYATGADYSAVITTGTVDGVDVAGYVLFTFSIENRFDEVADVTLAGGVTHGDSGAVLNLNHIVITASGGFAGINVTGDNKEAVRFTGETNGSGLLLIGAGTGSGLECSAGGSGAGGIISYATGGDGPGMELYGDGTGADLLLGTNGKITGTDPIVTADVFAISGDTTAADNLKSQYDGTGIIGGTFPSTQDQVTAISGALTLPAVAESRVLDDGAETNTFADTATHNEVFYIVTDNDNSDPGISVTLRGDIGDAVASHIHMHGFFQDGSGPFNNTCLMQAYDWEATAFETIRVLPHATSDDLYEPVLLGRHVSTTSNGPGGAEGKIDLRFLMGAQDGGSGSTINIDHLEFRYVDPALTASEVWAFATRVLTAPDNITSDDSKINVTAGVVDEVALVGTTTTNSDMVAEAPTANENRDAVWAKTADELTGAPAQGATFRDKFEWLFNLSKNKITETATTTSVKKDDGSTEMSNSTISDAAGTFTRGEFTE